MKLQRNSERGSRESIEVNSEAEARGIETVFYEGKESERDNERERKNRKVYYTHRFPSRFFLLFLETENRCESRNYPKVSE